MTGKILIDLGDGAPTHLVAGRRGLAASGVSDERQPMIVAIHGGGFTSAYFDCGGFSLLDRATSAGCPVLGINRPGYGESQRLPEGDRAIPRNADTLQAAIGQVWRERDFDAAGIVLVGHSIGSAVALYIAAKAPDWPLLGVSFSGMALSPPPNIPAFWNDHRPEEWLHTPADFRKMLMFGPVGSYTEGAPELCDSVSEPVWWREIVEIYTLWPTEFADVCARVRVPVHYRQATQDNLWANEQEEIDRLSRAFTQSPSVDCARLPNSGHCIDFHLAGEAFHAEQIAFAKRCVVMAKVGAR